MRCKPKHLLCSNTTNNSPDKQRGVSKETTGKEREREGMGWWRRRWWCGSLLMSQTTFCFAWHHGGLTICMAGRHTGRANNAHLGAPWCFVMFEQYTAPAPLLWGMKEINSKRGDVYKDISKQAGDSPPYYRKHLAAILLRTFGDVQAGHFHLNSRTLQKSNFPHKIHITRVLRGEGLRNLKYYFLKSCWVWWWISLMLWSFSSLMA